MSTDVLLFDSLGEVCEFDPATFWTCTCGATTVRRGRVPSAAPTVCRHVDLLTRNFPHDLLARMATAARDAAGSPARRRSSLPA